MIPVFLSIQGLYSYQNTQEIDFRKLMSAQLFGIFGSVGSGKSSILEAITFALYGESERLNSKEKRAYNMMNLRSDTLRIVFEFESGSPQQLYRCEVNGKRNKKDFHLVEIKRSFYTVDNEIITPIIESEILEAIGLSYEHFKRTIIIPQGKFQDFVHLSSSERTKMLQEIFQLERFDLASKTNSLSKKNELEKERTQGELSAYEKYNEADLSQFESKIKENEIQLHTLKEISIEFSKIKDEYYSKVKKHDALLLNKTELSKILEKSAEIQHKKSFLDQYISYKSIFQSDLLKLSFVENQILVHDNAITQLNLSKSKLQLDLESLKTQKSKLEPDFERVDFYKQEISDLKRWVEIRQKKIALSELNQKVETAKKWFEEVHTQQQLVQSEILDLKEKIEHLKKNTAKRDEFYQIKEWYSSFELWNHNHQKLTQNEKELIQIQQEKLHNYVNRFKKQNLDEVFNYILESKSKNEVKIQELRLKEREILIKNEISKFSNQLILGNPCPICGSTEHPSPISAHNVEDELQEVKSELDKVEKIIEQIAIYEKAHVEFSATQKNELANISVLQTEIQKNQQELNLLQEKYTWTTFASKNAFDTAFDTLKEFENELLQLEQKKDKKELDLTKLGDQLEKGRSRFQELVQEETKYSSEIKTLEDQIQLVKTISGIDFLTEINQKETRLNTIIREYTEATQKLQELEQLFAVSEANINNHLTQKGISLEEKLKITLDLDQKLRENNSTLEKVTEILAIEIDENKIRKEISDFEEKRVQLETIVKSLEQELTQFHPNKEYIAKIEEDLLHILNKIQELTDETATFKSKLIELTNALETKKQLTLKLNAIITRESSLKIMKDLFRGAGFVNYISSIYLIQLCSIANTRFRKLTNQQMELEIGDDNNFYIKDFLHNGQLRHVKTLSGGQTFQISLSLALALAESIQQQQRNQQNFFFLDEGFGTLDKDALGLVFETLKLLRKENRYVGLISHVEELQQEIPLAIRVLNDSKNGSIIQTIEY